MDVAASFKYASHLVGVFVRLLVHFDRRKEDVTLIENVQKCNGLLLLLIIMQ